MKTSFNITNSLLNLENAILANMDIPRVVFHNRMIDDFVRRGGSVNPRLLISKRTDPDYIKMEAVEQIYLNDERRAKIEELAEQFGCKKSKLLFQMLLDYCCLLTPEILGDVTQYIKK